jgi:uncharacterized protein YkwD
MAKILSYNSSSSGGGKSNIFKNTWDFIKSQDKYTKLSIITVLLIILGTPFLVNNLLETRQRAAGGDCTVLESDNAHDSEEEALFQLINNYRQGLGLNPYRLAPSVQKSATWKAKDMAVNSYLGNTDTLGRSPGQRITDCGNPNPSWSDGAYAGGQERGQEAFDALKNYNPFDSKLKSSFFSFIGITRYYHQGSPYGWYWGIDFSALSEAEQDTQPPSVTITHPTNGGTLNTDRKFRVTATDDYAVNNVELYVNGSRVTSDPVPPYELLWNAAVAGIHTAYVKAIDTSNNATTSSTISFTVSGTTTPTHTPTPTPTIPPPPPPADTDGDGFNDNVELYLGTDPNKKCANTSVRSDEPEPDAWPLDFDDNKIVNTLDVGRLVTVLNKSAEDPGFNPRMDLNMDRIINTIDAGKFVPFLNQTCSL